LFEVGGRVAREVGVEEVGAVRDRDAEIERALDLDVEVPGGAGAADGDDTRHRTTRTPPAHHPRGRVRPSLRDIGVAECPEVNV
jgi:hypothetical protein